MTSTSQNRPQPSARQASSPGRDAGPSGWAGWVVFAGVMLILASAFQIIEGLVALFNSNYYVVHPSGLVINVNYTTWGWAHILLGVLAALTGFGLLVGNMVARVVGVILAMVLAVMNMVFIPAAPVWGIMLVAVDILVIYAIVAHGRELKDSV